VSQTTPAGGWWQRNKDRLERYGMVAVGVIVVLFVLETTVLVTLLRMGVDFGPFLGWVSGAIGLDVSGVVEAAGTFGVAYAITRVLKPFQLALAALLTPPLASWLGHTHGEEVTAGVDEEAAAQGASTPGS